MAKAKTTAAAILADLEKLPPNERSALLVLITGRLAGQLPRTVVRIPPTLIDPDERNPRKRFDPIKLRSLGHSMRQYRQYEPIQVRPDGHGRFVLISGERRWQAANIVHLQTLDAIIDDLSPDDAIMAMVVSNLERERLTAIEEARCCKLLTDPPPKGRGMTHEAAAVAMGFSTGPSVTHRLQLLTLPQVWQDAIEAGFKWSFAREALVPHANDRRLLERAYREYEKNPAGWSTKPKVALEIEKMIGSRANRGVNFSGPEPSTDVRDLAIKLANSEGKSRNEIAAEFFNGDQRKAKSTLAQIRRLVAEGRIVFGR